MKLILGTANASSLYSLTKPIKDRAHQRSEIGIGKNGAFPARDGGYDMPRSKRPGREVSSVFVTRDAVVCVVRVARSATWER